jgi:deazaflavin-dependent oxidoreductase (nitroreductase family)
MAHPGDDPPIIDWGRRPRVPIPRAVARFNRHVTNPIVGLFAGWAPGFCILRHIGRRSGRTYSIPLNLVEDGDSFVFALTYGANTDWVENVMAAGGCTIRHRRTEIPLTNPRFLSHYEGIAHFSGPPRLMLRLANVTEFLRLDRA